MATIFRFLNPEATRNHILVLKRLLRKLYIEEEIVDERAKFIRPLSALSPENFPISSDLLALARRELSAIEAGAAEAEIVSLEDEEDSEARKNRLNTKIGLSQRAELLSDLELAKPTAICLMLILRYQTYMMSSCFVLILKTLFLWKAKSLMPRYS